MQESFSSYPVEEDEDEDYVYQGYEKEGEKKKFVPGIKNLMIEMDRYVARGVFG